MGQAENRSKAEEKILKLLDDATNTSLGLSPDEAVYDLPYISKMLATVSANQERLSDISMKLTLIAIETTKAHSAAEALYDLKERDVKETRDYRTALPNERKAYLADKLRSEEKEREEWLSLKRLVSEVREAVSKREQTMRRLDSDLRLHSQMYAVGKQATGAFHPATHTGQRTGLDIE